MEAKSVVAKKEEFLDINSLFPTPLPSIISKTLNFKDLPRKDVQI